MEYWNTPDPVTIVYMWQKVQLEYTDLDNIPITLNHRHRALYMSGQSKFSKYNFNIKVTNHLYNICQLIADSIRGHWSTDCSLKLNTREASLASRNTVQTNISIWIYWLKVPALFHTMTS
jgi:hypothetical protein